MKDYTEEMVNLVKRYNAGSISPDSFNLKATKILLHGLIYNAEYDLVEAYMEAHNE